MSSSFRLYRRLFGETHGYRVPIGALVALSATSSVFALLTPLPLKIAVDSVIGNHPMPGFIAALVPDSLARSRNGALLVASALFVVIALVKQLQSFGQLWLTTYTGQRLLLSLRSRLFGHAEELSLAYHDKHGATDSTYRIQYDAQSIQDVAVAGVIPFFTAGLTIAGMIYVTAEIDWQLALVSIAMVPALFLTFRVYRARLRGRWHDTKRLESSALSVVQEALEALRVVKAFGREGHERERFIERSARSIAARLGLAIAEGWFGLAIGLIMGSAMAAVLFLGTRRVIAGTLTVGNLTLVMGYLQQLYDPLKTASKKAGDLQASLASVERVYELLDHETGLPEATRAHPLHRARGEITFEHVWFGYGGDRPVLRDLNLLVPAGSRVGISGETGAGKTTLAGLLTRFYDVTDGRILIDGIDLRRYRLQDLRRQYAIVLQEPVLFSASIAENISYARPEATPEEIEAAAHAANAHDFIVRLPHGYQTQVGMRGMRLSGGERQRITLARAFLKDAPILILDEPTSSVDTHTEALITQAMQRLMAGRTTLMITHRLSTLEGCDLRVEVEKGILSVTDDASSGRRVRTPTPVHTHVAHGTADGDRVYGKAAELSARLNAAVATAWTALATESPSHVETTLVRGPTVLHRLWPAGCAATAVLGKRMPRERALLERSLHEHIFPRLEIPQLRFRGYVEDEDPAVAWIFVDDPGGTAGIGGDQIEILGSWLGHLHGSAARLGEAALAAQLPRSGLGDHYGRIIARAKARLAAGFDSPALHRSDRKLIRSIISLCTLAEYRLPALAELGATMKSTLVHGDPSSGFMRLLAGEAYALDWEFSGWLPPVADLYLLHNSPEARRSYRDALAQHGETGTERWTENVASLAHGLRLLAAVEWASPYLDTPWPEKGMARLKAYEAPLRTWLETRLAA